ncbi:MAG: sigma-70 family RNA polymerase sigma factor [Parvibaculaceae bacterium]
MDDPDELSAALARCSSGDQDALRLIFEREGGRLVAMAQRIVRRRDLAEEVVQEAFVQIWTKATQYEPGRGSARGWIYAIVRNRALNLLRDSRWEETASTDPDELPDAEAIEQAEMMVMRLDTRSRLLECLSRLDEPKRRSILMAYVLGQTHGEIAGRLRVPLGTAKAWVRRGLASLRDCMA